MEDIKERFNNHYLLGCIKYNNEYSLYLMPIAWWILNQKKYNPGYDPKKWDFVFRDHIYNVTDNEVPRFMISIAEDKLTFDELKSFFANNVLEESIFLHFYIDFDNKLFVNGFEDIGVEEYLPDIQWKGVFESPFNYLPDEIKNVFVQRD